MIASSQLNIGQLLKTPLANSPDQEIVHGNVSRYTYRELNQRLQRLAGALQGLGVGAGNVVAVLDYDSHRYFECYFAVPMMGAVLHTVNVRLSPDQLVYTINHAEDDVILVHEDFLPLLQSIADRIDRPVKLVLLQDVPTEVDSELSLAGEYEDLLAKAPERFDFPQFDENTPATTFYTTGTTGDPKGVRFSHRQIVLHTLGFIATLAPIPQSAGFGHGDVYMPLTPLFHVHAWGFPFVATLLGLKQVYPGRFDPSKALALIAEHDVTFSHCVPTILFMMLNAPESEATDLSRWKMIIGGSALTPGLAEAARDRGIDVNTGYGMSETCPLLTCSDISSNVLSGEDSIDPRVATGKAAPLIELGLRSFDGKFLPHDGLSVGEVVARGPWLATEYMKNPEGTAALWKDGWLHTGDIGTIGPNGTLRIGDRLKDVIKSGGEWVSSLDLEKLVSNVDGVAEVAAVGVSDDRWGERPMLAVVCADSGDSQGVHEKITAVFQASVADGELSKWAVPSRIEFVDAIPKTSVGKIDKKLLRATYAAG